MIDAISFKNCNNQEFFHGIGESIVELKILILRLYFTICNNKMLGKRFKL